MNISKEWIQSCNVSIPPPSSDLGSPTHLTHRPEQGTGEKDIWDPVTRGAQLAGTTPT